MKLDILCQQSWMDSWESCIYFEDENIESYTKAIEWIAEKCNKLKDYDPIHGFYFTIWIDGEEKGYYEKDKNKVHLDYSFLRKLAIEELSFEITLSTKQG